jgi:hypothetical protein
MKSPWPLTDKVTRLEALRRYELLEPSPDHSLDDLTAKVASICATPVLLRVLPVDARPHPCERTAQRSER